MTPQAFYGAAYPQLCAAEQQLVALIGRCPVARDSGDGEKAVLYCKSRIKTPESMMRKLEKNGLPPTGRAALEPMSVCHKGSSLSVVFDQGSLTVSTRGRAPW